MVSNKDVDIKGVFMNDITYHFSVLACFKYSVNETLCHVSFSNHSSDNLELLQNQFFKVVANFNDA